MKKKIILSNGKELHCDKTTRRRKHFYYYINDLGAKVWHREDGPAIVEYYYVKTNKIYYESYYLHGKQHRIDGFSQAYYDINGNITSAYHLIDDKPVEDGLSYLLVFPNGKMEHYRFNGKTYFSYEQYMTAKKTI